jgi:hypothetical protein
MKTNMTKCTILIKILRHVDLMLGSNRQINNYTAAVTRQRPLNNNRGKVFSVRSLLKCYKQDKLGVR